MQQSYSYRLTCHDLKSAGKFFSASPYFLGDAALPTITSELQIHFVDAGLPPFSGTIQSIATILKNSG
ncbi:MAG: hypothetical protein ACK5RH_10375, partial [Burkholderiales bacterium]